MVARALGLVAEVGNVRPLAGIGRDGANRDLRLVPMNQAARVARREQGVGRVLRRIARNEGGETRSLLQIGIAKILIHRSKTLVPRSKAVGEGEPSRKRIVKGGAVPIRFIR